MLLQRLFRLNPSRPFSTTSWRNSGKETPKTLGRHPRSITAPLAAFTMALLLCSYCVSSIRAARREARYHPSASTSPAESIAAGSSSGSSMASVAWITKALEEERIEKQGKNQKP
ncbi:hypothetical protein BGW36DRAFT_385970 [Talaromyces proteolyticus]|uniref:Uncharacterized protein n=1 Tax=Talaromyces proteolyticus TaxID=1131652 RepID=A0AAD4KK88_9EURO|nr:uncharacterized protein BGW36DRAFT_385970 [Talaromyces proteolyticus]KAH8693146.1 hypothetical protein BGW36DRAFT_385970 [Talaromyces proteolyticus]